MADIFYSEEVLKTSLAELKNAATEWHRETEGFTGENVRDVKEKLMYCEKIISEYAQILEKICMEYDSTEQELMRIVGGVL